MILEICQLQVKPHLSPADPSLLAALADARAELRETVYETHSRFYQGIEDPALIFILGVWPTLALHHAFLASPQRSQILASQEDLFVLGWVLHIEIGEEGMGALPLDAPVMAIARWFIPAGDEHAGGTPDGFRAGRDVIVGRSNAWKVVEGWRVDCEDGKREAVMLVGWEDVDAHGALATQTRVACLAGAAVGQHHEGMELKLARAMEARTHTC